MIDEISQVHRPKLGSEIPIIIFRAFRHFSANYANDLLGERGANLVFQNAGKDLGREVSKLIFDQNIEKYLSNIINFVKDEKIGILIPVELSKNRIILQLDECITCAGMSNIGKRICHFEVGFAQGLVEAYLNKKIKAHESKCGANGEGICEVTLEINNAQSF
ncbi:MAG TPA: 4-vinyl reductase [Sulfurihydrogenibium sp.]|uniref:V4R domain-containing protein n=1 Tax=Sulfurihydrogenibium sp. (strain YO3AOP1) TaxID=436114 RepID=UPI0001725907|nr:V4R domain-containing protein [Sulfurihydrogenibium sp. YO3AOP1]ACD66101.1 4-vinyl reductase 4VR [Sulfurihydrogenibium sp. YO3AOP1]HBT98996.1 4-vinyl reductase [Sulfurihydrogenibium sp.]